MEDGGGPVTDTCEFELYGADSGGTQINGTLNEVVTVDDGLFTVKLDFSGMARSSDSLAVRLGTVREKTHPVMLAKQRTVRLGTHLTQLVLMMEGHS